TAPSTQPPDTEPTAVSSGPTSIDAPGGRGADWKVATTVATPIVSPASHHLISSGSTSRTAGLPHCAHSWHQLWQHVTHERPPPPARRRWPGSGRPRGRRRGAVQRERPAAPARSRASRGAG